VRIRRQARIAALQALFEIDAVHHNTEVVLQRRLQDLELPPEAAEFARFVVHGVLEHQGRLDEMIIVHAPEWPIDQMAIIDRNILRIALFEFVVDGGTPPKVAINEAVELAKLYGSDSSQRFVNGVLGTLLSKHTSLMQRRGKKRR
jgi:N utilization substance protein B